MTHDPWQRLNEQIVRCRRCPRLAPYIREVAQTKRRAYRDQVYWGKPVPGFGDRRARLLIIGLAPAAHGANRTGRMFTGDASGMFLAQALYRHGFANQPISRDRNDGLVLKDVFLSAVVRCAPPQNRPTLQEIQNCLPFLEEELWLLDRLQVVLTLGAIATRGYVTILKRQGWVSSLSEVPFGHHRVYRIHPDLPVLVTSYHPSRQNTQTGRLTADMFDQVFETIRGILEGDGRGMSQR